MLAKDIAVPFLALLEFFASARPSILAQGKGNATISNDFKCHVADGFKNVTVSGSSICYLEKGANSAEAKPIVLFLHGMAYTASTWKEIGALDAVVSTNKYRAIAVDLPGHGGSHGATTKHATTTKFPIGSGSTFISDFLLALGVALTEKIILVAASMGGKFAIPFMNDAADRVAGYVTIAAAGSELASQKLLDVKTLIIWGEKDNPYSLIANNTKASLGAHAASNQFIVFNDATHAAYLHDKQLFNALLAEFIHRTDKVISGSSQTVQQLYVHATTADSL